MGRAQLFAHLAALTAGGGGLAVILRQHRIDLFVEGFLLGGGLVVLVFDDQDQVRFARARVVGRKNMVIDDNAFGLAQFLNLLPLAREKIHVAFELAGQHIDPASLPHGAGLVARFLRHGRSGRGCNDHHGCANEQ